MLRLLALSLLLALAAPQAVAEQVPFCQIVLKRMEMMESEQDLEQVLELLKSAKDHDLHPDVAKALRELEEELRKTDPGTAVRTVNEWYRYKRTQRAQRTPKQRYYVPYPLSRELLSGAVNPCDSTHASCPRELENIYDGLERNRDDEDSWHYRYYQNRLESYYYWHYPLSRELPIGAVNPCASSRLACPRELENIYDGLERNRDDEDSWHYRYYQNQLESYYRHYRP